MADVIADKPQVIVREGISRIDGGWIKFLIFSVQLGRVNGILQLWGEAPRVGITSGDLPSMNTFQAISGAVRAPCLLARGRASHSLKQKRARDSEGSRPRRLQCGGPHLRKPTMH